MKPVKKPIWSNLDAFALLNGISTWDPNYNNLLYVRKPYEDNLDLRDNIVRSHDYKPDITKQGLINGLYNEFNLVPYNVTTKKIFNLTYNPIPSGDYYTQDISGFYKTSSGTWETLGPQIYSTDYQKAKDSNIGFIVWQNEKFTNISGYKNFTYSNIVEVLRTLSDKTEVKFEYYINVVDEDNNVSLQRYTDMKVQTDLNDDRYTYKIPYSGIDLSSGILAYNLNNIPDECYSFYYDSYNHPKELLYTIQSYVDNKFYHTYDKIKNKTCIWDVGNLYGSGDISNFYDACAPENNFKNNINYTGFIGGVDSLSYSLYTTDIIADSGNTSWYYKIYPGKFYINGISFYYFENPQSSYSSLSNITSGEHSGLYYCTMPSGLERGMHVITAKSGYYDTYYSNFSRDSYLSGIYEDYSYRTGADCNKVWSNIYRHRPYLTRNTGIDTQLNIGEYYIDYNNSGMYFKIPTTYDYKDINIIWDNVLTPSGTYLAYDLNPLNDTNLFLDKFFMYLSLAPNGYYSGVIRI